jgi:glyoxylase-like metal-dependent hydrolase (beta-lactamase superfamily II)
VLSRVGKANAGALLRDGDCLELRYTLVKRGDGGGAGKRAMEEVDIRVRSSRIDVGGEWELRVEHSVIVNSSQVEEHRAGAENHHAALRRVSVGGHCANPLPSLRFDVLATPCHTRGHVVFLLREAWECTGGGRPEAPFLGGRGRGGGGEGAGWGGAGSRRGSGGDDGGGGGGRVVRGEGADTRGGRMGGEGGGAAAANAPRHCLFSGDLLFSGGQGAPFEGPSIEMLQNLHTVLARASEDTLVFPGHEYTEMLMGRQLAEMGGDVSAKRFLRLAAAAQRARHRRAPASYRERVPTVPVHLEEELDVNPALRQVEEQRRLLRRYLLIFLARAKVANRRCDALRNIEAVTQQEESHGGAEHRDAELLSKDSDGVRGKGRASAKSGGQGHGGSDTDCKDSVSRDGVRRVAEGEDGVSRVAEGEDGESRGATSTATAALRVSRLRALPRTQAAHARVSRLRPLPRTPCAQEACKDVSLSPVIPVDPVVQITGRGEVGGGESDAEDEIDMAALVVERAREQARAERERAVHHAATHADFRSRCQLRFLLDADWQVPRKILLLNPKH